VTLSVGYTHVSSDVVLFGEMCASTYMPYHGCKFLVSGSLINTYEQGRLSFAEA
jgi:hypothetical protein